MITIQLKVSEGVADRWQRFLEGSQGLRLVDAGVLGDWVLTAFMLQVDEYLEHGLPQERQAPPPEEPDDGCTRRKLTKMQKRVLPMYNENDNQTQEEIARVLGIDPSQAGELIQDWLEEGFLTLGPLRDGQQSYLLGLAWQRHNLTANRPSLNTPRILHLPENLKP